jgi:hypothetical protein
VHKLLLLLCASGVAAGASIEFTGLPINTQFGTFNGFALATVDGVANQLLICDDFSHTTYMPSGPLTYDGSTLSDSDPLEYARFATQNDTSGSAQRYEEAALLLEGLSHTGPGELLDLTADYQYALWSLFTPSVPLPDVTARTLLSNAEEAALAGSPQNLEVYSRLRILTPSEPFAGNQEFLQLLDSPPPVTVTGPLLGAPAPEPSSFLLIGLGIALLAVGVGGKRLRRTP